MPGAVTPAHPTLSMSAWKQKWNKILATLRQTMARSGGGETKDTLELLVRMYAHEVRSRVGTHTRPW